MSCIFCKIVAGEIPATVVRRTADAVTFRDLNPQAPTHVLVVPTKHVAGMADTDSDDGEKVVGKTMRLAAQVAKDLGLDETGYRLVTNNGAEAGQSVFHLHIHVLGGRRFSWPPG